MSTKRKRGRAETRQSPGWPPSVPPPKEKSSHTHKFWIEYLTIPRSHCEVYLQVSLLFYAFSAGLCQLCLEGHVCVCVCVCVCVRARAPVCVRVEKGS